MAYRVEISFCQFLTTEDELEYDVFYFKNKADKSPEKLELKTQKVIIDKTEGQVPKAIVDFTLFKKDLKENDAKCYILFICRLRLEENKYYPISLTDEKRYIGAMFRTEEKIMDRDDKEKPFKNSDHQGRVAINTLPKLKSKEAWSNLYKRRVK